VLKHWRKLTATEANRTGKKTDLASWH